MYYAQINPITVESSIYKKTIEVSYISICVTPYFLGSVSSTFTVRYGNVILDSIGNVKKFNQIATSKITLDADKLSTWGLDDTIIMNYITEILNLQIIKIVTFSSETK